MALDKVIDSAKHKAELKSIADSIRAKGKTTAQFKSAAEMKQAVDNISTGKPEEAYNKKYTANGKYPITPTSGKTINGGTIEVAVPSKAPVIKPKNIVANGTYNAADDGADGYSPVVVDCPSKPEQEKTVNITEAGTYDVEVLPDAGKTMNKVIAKVDVKGGGGSSFPNGAEWTKSNAYFSGGGMYVVDYCAANDSWVAFSSFGPGYWSNDGGKTWTRSKAPQITSPQMLTVSGLTIIGSVNQKGTPIISHDGGKNWAPTALPVQEYTRAVKAGGNWIIVGEDGTYYSENDGVTWQKSVTGCKSSNCKLCSTCGTIVAIEINPKYSYDFGKTWNDTGYKHGGATALWTYAGEFYFSNDTGIHKSSNNGQNWEKISDTKIRRCTVCNGCFIGSDSQGVLKSNDFGQTWTRKFSNNHITGIQCSNTVILMSTYGPDSILYSFDQGETWQTARLPSDNFYLNRYENWVVHSGREWLTPAKEGSSNLCILRSAIWEPPV